MIEHLTFIHGVIPDSINFLYFSENREYMLERLKYDKHILYRRSLKPALLKGSPTNNTITWVRVHTFSRFPNDIIHLTQYPFVFSPNFTYYLDLDEDHTSFIIRSSIDEREVYDIPLELMNAEEEDLKDVVRRFRWIDEEQLHIINHEGIERIVNINDNFKEKQFNFIPLYDSEICKKTHYMLDPVTLHLDDLLGSLKQRYQDYKTNWHFVRDFNKSYSMQKEIFNVNYRIEDCNGRYETSMSFCFVLWSLIE